MGLKKIGGKFLDIYRKIYGKIKKIIKFLLKNMDFTAIMVLFLSNFLGILYIMKVAHIFEGKEDANLLLKIFSVSISSVTSFLMVYLTTLMLSQSRRQLNEIRRQREEDERARLGCSIMVHELAFYLKIVNIGKRNAYEISLNVNEDFINNLNLRDRRLFEDLKNPFFIEAGQSIYLPIGDCKTISQEWEYKNIKLILNGSYNGQYKIDETFLMDQFIRGLYFYSKVDLERTMIDIKNGLTCECDKSIQQSLDIIASALSKNGH